MLLPLIAIHCLRYCTFKELKPTKLCRMGAACTCCLTPASGYYIPRVIKYIMGRLDPISLSQQNSFRPQLTGFARISTHRPPIAFRTAGIVKIIVQLVGTPHSRPVSGLPGPFFWRPPGPGARALGPIGSFPGPNGRRFPLGPVVWCIFCATNVRLLWRRMVFHWASPRGAKVSDSHKAW